MLAPGHFFNVKMTCKLLPIAAWSLVVLAFLGTAASATDIGPRQDVATLRHDVPILLAAFGALGNGGATARVAVDSVAVDGDQALVQWRIADKVGVDGMIRIDGRWWERMREYPVPSLYYVVCYSPLRCDADYTDLTDRSLLAMGLSDSLIRLAFGRMPAIGTSRSAIESYRYDASRFLITGDYRKGSTDPDGFLISASFPRNDAPSEAFFQVEGRRPTQTESWTNRDSNRYFFFTMTLSSMRAVNFPTGTTIDVWFPFVIDSKSIYSMTIEDAGRVVHVKAARYADNTLYFVLPAFFVSPAAILRGEIRGET